MLLPYRGVSSHQLYALYDRRRGPRSRLLYSPGVFYHIIHPKGGRSGWLFLVTQSLGLEYDVGSITYTPYVALVAGRGKEARGFWEVFLTAGIGIMFHKAPSETRHGQEPSRP